jgi:hypothetical protein
VAAMMFAKIIGRKAWCARPGCLYVQSLASVSRDEQGSMFAKLTGTRWRRDGSVDGMEHYTTVVQAARIVETTRTGKVVRKRRQQHHPKCPIVVDCPGCGTPQVIAIPED